MRDRRILPGRDEESFPEEPKFQMDPDGLIRSFPSRKGAKAP